MKSDNVPTRYPISPYIKEQVPGWVRDDHETFVDFMEAYYEWTELPGNAHHRTGILDELSDIDNSLESFFSHFKNQYLHNFPVNLAINQDTGNMVSKEILTKNIKKFYGAKGTERSFKFLFRVLYDAYLEIYYPKKDIIKASDANWLMETSIKVSTGNGNNLYKMETRQIRQRDSRTKVVKAYARVTRVIQYREGRYDVCEVFLNDLYGIFDTGNSIECTIIDDNTGETKLIEETVFPVLSDIVVETPGQDYSVDQEVIVTTESSGHGAKGVLGTVTPKGGVSYIKMVDFGVGYDNYADPPTFTIKTVKGTGGTVTGTVGALCAYDGYWTTNDGKISSTKKMQDNYYYQSFSYVLKTEITIDNFRETVKKLVHPAGLKMFGAVLLTRDHLVPLESRTYMNLYEIPLLGHYTPYTFKTWENLRSNSQDIDLYPCGHNPTTGGGIANYSDVFEGGTTPHRPSGDRVGDTLEENIIMQFDVSGDEAMFFTGNYIIQGNVTGERGTTGTALTGGLRWGNTGPAVTPGYAVGRVISNTKNTTGSVVELDVLSQANDNFHFMLGNDWWLLGANDSLTTGGSVYGGPYITGYWPGSTGSNFHMLNIGGALHTSGSAVNCIDISITGPLNETEWSGNNYWAIYPHPAQRGVEGISGGTDRHEVTITINVPYEEGNDYSRHEVVTQGHLNPYNNEPIAPGASGAVGHVISWDPAPLGAAGGGGPLGSVLKIEEVDGHFEQYGGIYGFTNHAFYEPVFFLGTGDPHDFADIDRVTGNTETQFKHIQLYPFVRILKGDRFDSWGDPEYSDSGVTGISPIEDTCNPESNS